MQRHKLARISDYLPYRRCEKGHAMGLIPETGRRKCAYYISRSGCHLLYYLDDRGPGSILQIITIPACSHCRFNFMVFAYAWIDSDTCTARYKIEIVIEESQKFAPGNSLL